MNDNESEDLEIIFLKSYQLELLKLSDAKNLSSESETLLNNYHHKDQVIVGNTNRQERDFGLGKSYLEPWLHL